MPVASKVDKNPVKSRKAIDITAAPKESLVDSMKAAHRMIAVKSAYDDLIAFTKLHMPDPRDPDDTELSRYTAKNHHHAIAQALEDMEAGKILRLIITLPPRAGKSELAAKRFIPWLWGRDPYRQIIFATYNETFSEDTGRAVRACMKMPVYNQVFPKCNLKKGSMASDRLETEEGGIAVFIGTGGAATGRGSDFLLLDDLIKDREQADSPLERQKQWEWFTDVAHTRLMSDFSRILIITTRWHEDDLVGRLTDPQNDNFDEIESAKWKILKIPAIAEDNDPIGRKKGEALWPEKFPIPFLESARRLNKRSFSALYQCTPTPEEGIFFIKETLHTYRRDELPTNLRMYCGSDHAVSTKQGSDSTVLMPIGLDESGTIWVMPDVFWRKADTMTVTEAMLQLMGKYSFLSWWAENGHISQSIGPFLRKRMLEESIFCNIVEKTPVRDKQTRAQAIQARCAMGRVRFPGFAHWWVEAKDQLLKFPASAHDDFVDALAWVGIGLNHQVAASREQKPSDLLPRPGSLEWVKWADKAEKAEKLTRHGF